MRNRGTLAFIVMGDLIVREAIVAGAFGYGGDVALQEREANASRSCVPPRLLRRYLMLGGSFIEVCVLSP